MRRDRLAALGDLLGVAARRHGEGRIAVEPAVAFVGTLGKAAVRGDEGRAGLEARPDPGCGADTLVALEEMEGEEAGRAVEGAGGRAEEGRGGRGGGSSCRTRWSQNI